MTDYAAYLDEMRAKEPPDLRAENETLRGILSELLTPPLRFGDKREVVERGRLILEGWKGEGG